MLNLKNETAYSSSPIINAEFTYHLWDLDAFKQGQNQMSPQARQVTKLHMQGAQWGKWRGYKAPKSTSPVILGETLIQDLYGKALKC